MLALESKARLEGWSETSQLLKVAGLAEFARGEVPIERMVLDLREPDVLSGGHGFLSLPWAGFITNGASVEGRRTITLLDEQTIAKPGDVIEVLRVRSKIAVRYRRGDNGNVLFATERCNSFCMMCSQPPREIEDSWRIAQLCTLVELIDKDLPSIAISGGEPTLLGEGLAQVVSASARSLPQTHVHVLSNGRRFAEMEYAATFNGLHPSLSWGIPLYGDHFALHDYVVQSSGAFAQTVRGLYALHAAGQRIEIRVVLVRPVVERLPEIARFIYRSLPFVEHVALMGVEPIGFARAHHEVLWVDPVDAASALSESVGFLASRAMPVSLYNLPLCALPRHLWPFAKRSISQWKQDYIAACDGCDIREQCGGFFAWVTPEWTSRAIKPVKLRGESSDA
jgi:His-Xaa-Ser system radical SAM maturase HxsC